MPLKIVTFELGEMANNTYLVADPGTRQAVVIDPSFDSEVVLEEIARRSWQITGVWLTHAHFDHVAGVRRLVNASQPPIPVGLHPADLPLLRQGGGARLFGIQVDEVPAPAIHFDHGQQLRVGAQWIEVRHTPGHTPGHVIFYAAESGVAFCGDLIFFHGVGRTDLPGGDYQALLQSLHTQVFTLPPETRLLSGHGPETTVLEEKE
jgi:glyoxylase-like metal-dependent hydrolase (beta-lactamase superfamily II)